MLELQRTSHLYKRDKSAPSPVLEFTLYGVSVTFWSYAKEGSSGVSSTPLMSPDWFQNKILINNCKYLQLLQFTVTITFSVIHQGEGVQWRNTFEIRWLWFLMVLK